MDIPCPDCRGSRYAGDAGRIRYQNSQGKACSLPEPIESDVIRNADYIIDMGPGGGNEGGRIVDAGTPGEIKNTAEISTGKYL